MGKIHFVLVCHCDRVEWPDSAYDFDDMESAIRKVIEKIRTIEREYSVQVPMTCLACFMHDREGYSVAHERIELFRELFKMGNEIGVHTHVGYDELPSQDSFITSDADDLENLGFPRPKTWAAGDWYTTANTIRQLEKGGYAVDCSVVPLEGKFYHGSWKQFEIDYSRCRTLSPYHPSYDDICLPGGSSVVELPVTGWLPELCYPDQHFPLARENLEDRLLSKWRKKDRNLADVFHVFWHPQDFWLPHYAWYPQDSDQHRRLDHQLLDSTERLLRMAADLDDLQFSTAYQAAENWLENEA